MQSRDRGLCALRFTLTMSMTWIEPLPKIIAFGGVAKKKTTVFFIQSGHGFPLPIGNMKARETARIDGRMRKPG